jgi:branched-chain amino acid transport system permease protein
MEFFVGNTLNGLSSGFILFLVATGLTVALGLMRTLNLAHGAFYMVGGYVTWEFTRTGRLPFVAALLLGAALVAVLGLVLDALFLRFIGDNLGGQVLATFGALTVLTNLSEWRWNSEPKAPVVPDLLKGSVDIFGVKYPIVRLGIIAIGAGLAIAIWWVQERAMLGSMVRAGMDDREIASAVGINVNAVARTVFVIGAFIAGLSGGLGQSVSGLSTDAGVTTLLLALIVIILGGLGSLLGALIGALLLGLVTAFGTATVPDLVSLAPYALMVIILVVRPRGLLGRVETRAG